MVGGEVCAAYLCRRRPRPRARAFGARSESVISPRLCCFLLLPPLPRMALERAAADTAADADSIYTAALAGDLRRLRDLTHLRNTATSEGYTPLGLAVSAGQTEAVRLLLREGVQVDAADNIGVTALCHASMHGYAELTDLLMLHGASPRHNKKDGMNAVGLAALYGRPAALGAMFRADATLVNERDDRGRTAMHWAVVSAHAPTVRYLIGCWGAAVDVLDSDGDSPLHLATQRDILLYLFHGTSHPPSLSLINRAGQTPAQAATAGGADEFAEWLTLGAAAVADPSQADASPLHQIHRIDRVRSLTRPSRAARLALTSLTPSAPLSPAASPRSAPSPSSRTRRCASSPRPSCRPPGRAAPAAARCWWGSRPPSRSPSSRLASRPRPWRTARAWRSSACCSMLACGRRHSGPSAAATCRTRPSRCCSSVSSARLTSSTTPCSCPPPRRPRSLP